MDLRCQRTGKSYSAHW